MRFIIAGLLSAALISFAPKHPTPAHLNNSATKQTTQTVTTAANEKIISEHFAQQSVNSTQEQPVTQPPKVAEPETPKAQAKAEVQLDSSPEVWMTAAGIPKNEQSGYKELVTRESSWDSSAVNPSSGSCGLAQELPCGKSGCELGDPTCQLKWMKEYVEGRYGTIWSAIKFHNTNDWY